MRRLRALGFFEGIAQEPPTPHRPWSAFSWARWRAAPRARRPPAAAPPLARRAPSALRSSPIRQFMARFRRLLGPARGDDSGLVHHGTITVTAARAASSALVRAWMLNAFTAILPLPCRRAPRTSRSLVAVVTRPSASSSALFAPRPRACQAVCSASPVLRRGYVGVGRGPPSLPPAPSPPASTLRERHVGPPSPRSRRAASCARRRASASRFNSRSAAFLVSAALAWAPCAPARPLPGPYGVEAALKLSNPCRIRLLHDGIAKRGPLRISREGVALEAVARAFRSASRRHASSIAGKWEEA